MSSSTILPPRVLLAIEDLDLRRTFETNLRAAGFAVSAPGDRLAALTLARSFAPDIIVIDDLMYAAPHRGEYQEIRSQRDHYLMCLDSTGDETARVEFLRSGADDVVSIPVNPAELTARCQALLRRPRDARSDTEIKQRSVITLGPLTVDTGRREVLLCDELIPATRIEFSLLERLCERPTEVAPRDELLSAVWGNEWVGDTHVVDVHLSNLRRKFEQTAPHLRVLQTVRGIGFRISNEILDSAEADTAARRGGVMEPGPGPPADNQSISSLRT